MKIAYFDCIAGASGDMILGALVDAGLPLTALQELLAKLGLPEVEIRSRRVTKSGYGAVKVDVIIRDDVSERRLSDIEALIAGSKLPGSIKNQASGIFRQLGEIEAAIHGVTADEIHLHELGGQDTIVDVVGVLAGLDALGVERVYASALPVGRGFTQGAHGVIPLPAPATLEILKGIPVKGTDLEMELVTPTGAILLKSLVESFGPIPAMSITTTGYGAGNRDLPIPNLLRLLIGELEGSPIGTAEPLIALETNIDDLNPEIYDHVTSLLFTAGALDVTLSPIQMKKNRPGTRVQVLCRPGDGETLSEILFSETSTLGIRKQNLERLSLARSIQPVETPYGTVRVKVAQLREDQVKYAPEYEDCRRLAGESGVPLREIYLAAQLAARESGITL